ncbi:DNA mismatch repair protein MLH3 [Cladophialophora carrionii]|uniref:DNA mismatch repair protein MLH3 n=1 Tax=Cladophialophora carrionii TaxID=86049 RepID=A0A1C1CDC5_9EURO|nr:DNA mismatch repair protein MLH3 [Cladophialophora carrionii]
MCKEEVGLIRQGTNAVVHNLFGDVPVRLKQLSLRYSSAPETERAFERVKKMLVGYLLASPRSVEMRFTLRGEKQRSLRCSSSQMGSTPFSLESTVSILFQSKFLGTLDTKQWRSASVRTSHFSIRAAISTHPAPSKAAQFISVGQVPIWRGQGANFLFETIDRLFEASNFGALDDERTVTGNRSGRPDRNQPTTEVSKLGKGVDRWPMFYLRIDSKLEHISWLMGQDELSAEAIPVTDHLTKALESLISHFLTSSGFAHHAKPGDVSRSRAGIKHKDDPVDHLQSKLPVSELSRNATEARYLSYWNRVKSAWPSEENFRYGLGLDGTVEGVRSPADILEADRSPVEARCQECEAGIGLHNTQVANAEGADSTTDLVWTNPRTGQMIHLNPRTGAIAPAAGPQGDGRLEERYGHSSRVRKFPNPRSGRTMPQPRPPAETLQKYSRTTGAQRPEAPITSIAREECPALRGEQLGPGPATIAIPSSQAVTRRALSAAKVIQQVDQKFVLAAVSAPTKHTEGFGSGLLVLIDQHAADERIKFEQLCQEFCKRTSTTLSRPLSFEVNETEVRLLEEQRAHLQKWCLSYNLNKVPRDSTDTCKRSVWIVEVTALPSLLAERCRVDPKLLIDLMRREIWSDRLRLDSSTAHAVDQTEQNWWSDLARCPPGMIQMLKSRSCRTAIMFNDVLEPDQSRELVRKLAHCSFPFQCAHGRPTLTVVADFQDIESLIPAISAHTRIRDFAVGYGDVWRRWVDTD